MKTEDAKNLRLKPDSNEVLQAETLSNLDRQVQSVLNVVIVHIKGHICTLEILLIHYCL